MIRIQGIYVGSRRDFVDMNSAISLTMLRPVGESFHWTQAREVFERMGRSYPLRQAGCNGQLMKQEKGPRKQGIGNRE